MTTKAKLNVDQKALKTLKLVAVAYSFVQRELFATQAAYIAEKEVEEQSLERGQANRHKLRTDFWHQTLEALVQANVALYRNVGPSKDHWLNAGAGLGGVHYAMRLDQQGQ